jgi:hypothetical protein
MDLPLCLKSTEGKLFSPQCLRRYPTQPPIFPTVAQPPQDRPADARATGDADAVAPQNLAQIVISPTCSPRVRPPRNLRRRHHLHAATTPNDGVLAGYTVPATNPVRESCFDTSRPSWIPPAETAFSNEHISEWMFFQG